MDLPPAEVELPRAPLLADELETWRRCGVLRLHQLRLPGLGRAAQATGLAASSSESANPAVLKELVRSAIAPLSNSASGRCATVLLGLDPNTFDLAPHLLREDSAEILGLSLERFRREPQRQVMLVVANAVLELATAHRARLARLAMEQRHPADTRLAVQWLERFEAYFRIWTPVYALGADLTAYRLTLLDPDRRWDQRTNSSDAEGEPYTQEIQAAGHGTFALYHHASVKDAERQFLVRFGGLWLLSSPQAEAAARDALAAAAAYLPTNERDESWLRISLDKSNGEVHAFLTTLQNDPLGLSTHDEWQRWLTQCDCDWELAAHDPAVEYFPTARYHSNIVPSCKVHRTVEACGVFCATIEQEWLAIADWYSFADESSAIQALDPPSWYAAVETARDAILRHD